MFACTITSLRSTASEAHALNSAGSCTCTLFALVMVRARAARVGAVCRGACLAAPARHEGDAHWQCPDFRIQGRGDQGGQLRTKKTLAPTIPLNVPAIQVQPQRSRRPRRMGCWCEVFLLMHLEPTQRRDASTKASAAAAHNSARPAPPAAAVAPLHVAPGNRVVKTNELFAARLALGTNDGVASTSDASTSLTNG